MLTKGKCLCATKLCTLLFNTTQAVFASIRMFLSSHCHIILGRAAKSMINKEGAVASVQYVHFWISQ